MRGFGIRVLQRDNGKLTPLQVSSVSQYALEQIDTVGERVAG